MGWQARHAHPSWINSFGQLATAKSPLQPFFLQSRLAAKTVCIDRATVIERKKLIAVPSDRLPR